MVTPSRLPVHPPVLGRDQGEGRRERGKRLVKDVVQ